MNWKRHDGSLGKFIFGIALLLPLGLMTACGRNGVDSYIVPKERPAVGQAALPPNHPEVTDAPAAPQVAWTAPEGWQELPPGQFRVGSFKVSGPDGKQADVSIIPLPGEAGGELSNVNRWRGQVGQDPLTAAELKAAAESVKVAGEAASLYEQGGDPRSETRILGVIQQRDGMAWFIKMTGDDQLVAQQKPQFVKFLESIRFAPAGAARPPVAATPGAMEPLPAGHPEIGSLPAGHPEIAPMPAGHPDVSRQPTDSVPPASTASAARPQWTPPPHWKETAGGPFLVAKFTVGDGGKGAAAVNVSSSPGDGGGLAANVNRWRKQLGLAELTAAELASATQPVKTSSGHGSLVEMAGQDPRSGKPTAVIGAIVVLPNQTWFYKLMGDAPVVTAEKNTFTQFVEGVQY